MRACKFNIEVRVSTNQSLTAETPDVYTFVNVAPAGVFLRDHGPSTGIDSIVEGAKDRYTQWKRQTRQGSYVTMPLTSSQSKSSNFKGFINMKRFYQDYRGYSVSASGTTMTEMQWPQNYMAQTNTSPLALCELNVGVGSVCYGANLFEQAVPLTQMNARFVYYVEFFNPFTPAYSRNNVGVTGATGTGTFGGTGYIDDGTPFDKYA